MSTKPTTVPAKILAKSILSSGMSFTVNNILSWNGEDLSAGDFGSVAFGAFLSADRKTLELFKWDPSTIASNSITILARGLSYDGNLTPDVNNQFDWTGNETTILLGTDTPQFLSVLAYLGNNQTFTGLNIFSGFAPQTDTDPVADNDLTRKSYVLALVLGTLTTIDVIVPGTAGATIAAGNLVYFDDASNQWKLCTASTSTTVENVLLGIAQGAGTSGNPITNGILLQGVDTHQSALTDGQTMYASNTLGAISNSPGTTTVVVGISKGTTQLYFAPRFNEQLTQNQINALVGNNTDIPVGTGNKYVTQTGFQHNAEKYGADAGSTDDYVITLVPAPISYTVGMVVYFKANTVNTGGCTLNVNSLGAKTIVKGINSALATGDIAVGQFCAVVYDGTNFVLQSPVSNQVTQAVYNSGQATRASASGSGTQNIAHGLGVVPKLIIIRAVVNQATGLIGSYGNYNGTTNTATYWYRTQNTSGQGIAQDSSHCIYTQDASNTYWTAAVTAMDATNFTLTFVINSANTPVDFEWEAFG